MPKKRGRKPGFKKLHNPAATKKSTRICRDNDPDPAFDPVNKLSGDPSNVLTQRLSRRIKPTAKILANDELRYGFELQNNARLSLSSEHLDAERSPLKEDQPMPLPVIVVKEPSAPIEPPTTPDKPKEKTPGVMTTMISCSPRRRAPCPDPVEFLNAIKMEKINLNRSPEDNKKMSLKQRKRLFKLKEKHFNKLGLQRTRVNYPGSSHDSSEADEDEFVPNKKVSVGRPNVTLRLRANTTTLDKPPRLEPKRHKTNQQPNVKKRSYIVIPSAKHETSLILSTKHKHPKTATTTPPPKPASPVTTTPKSTEIDLTICLCAKPSKYYTQRTADTSLCRATDEIVGQLVGCCNEVAGDGDLLNLRRPSVRVKYSLLCAGHLQRLQAHQSCAGCGVFCTQGHFVMCPRSHLFHKDCATKFILNAPFTAAAEFVCPTLVLRCPHCGVDAPDRETLISMRCRTVPVFVPYQQRPPKMAKMSIGQHTHASVALAQQRSGGGGGHGGQRQFLWELEKLIPSHVMDVVLRSQDMANGSGGSEFTGKDVLKAIHTDNVDRMAEIIGECKAIILSYLCCCFLAQGNQNC